jgi:hypothetical protein
LNLLAPAVTHHKALSAQEGHMAGNAAFVQCKNGNCVLAELLYFSLQQ